MPPLLPAACEAQNSQACCGSHTHTHWGDCPYGAARPAPPFLSPRRVSGTRCGDELLGVGALRGGGEVLEIGQDVLTKFKNYANRALETLSNKQD